MISTSVDRVLKQNLTYDASVNLGIGVKAVSDRRCYIATAFNADVISSVAANLSLHRPSISIVHAHRVLACLLTHSAHRSYLENDRYNKPAVDRTSLNRRPDDHTIA
jgi:hypothetical protein